MASTNVSLSINNLLVQKHNNQRKQTTEHKHFWGQTDKKTMNNNNHQCTYKHKCSFQTPASNSQTQ